MNKYRRIGKLLVIVAIVLTLAWLSNEFYAFLQVDKCLDSGGAYDYEGEKCVYE